MTVALHVQKILKIEQYPKFHQGRKNKAKDVEINLEPNLLTMLPPLTRKSQEMQFTPNFQHRDYLIAVLFSAERNIRDRKEREHLVSLSNSPMKK